MIGLGMKWQNEVIVGFKTWTSNDDLGELEDKCKEDPVLVRFCVKNILKYGGAILHFNKDNATLELLSLGSNDLPEELKNLIKDGLLVLGDIVLEEAITEGE